jgi:putative DNA primase/helicase
MSNEVPRLPDASGALAGRFLIIRTPNTWKGREDRDLDRKLEAELPGILKWAADGWARLKGNGLKFTTNNAAEEYVRELEDLSSPVKAFVRECCRVGPECDVARADLFNAWLRWNETRHREVGSEAIFGRDLRSALPHVGDRYTKPKTGPRVRKYVGIGLREESEWGEEEDRAQVGSWSLLTHARADEGLNDSKEDEVYVGPELVGCMVPPAPAPTVADGPWAVSNDDSPSPAGGAF